MPDLIGNVSVPEVAPSGTFPLVTDFPHSLRIEPQIAVHRFVSGNTKIEQRYLVGNGARRWRAQWADLQKVDLDVLRNFWEARKASYQPFTYNAPSDDGASTVAYVVRFEDEPLSFEAFANAIYQTGVTLVEVPQEAPTYSVSATLSRFPNSTLESALTGQVQQLVPLVRIQPKESGYPEIFLSDRRCTVGGQLYQARLLTFEGISQRISGESDTASFVFGNADRVMRDLSADVDLFRARVRFSVYHVASQILVDLWSGEVVDYNATSDIEFTIAAVDGLYDLTLQYPTDKVSGLCWKNFDDGQGCPFSSAGALDLINFPSASAGSCDRGYLTDNGCKAHGMKRYFGGVIAVPQSVRIRDNSQGFFGYGRPTVTATSLVADSVQGQPLTEIYTDVPMPVKCLLVSGRDESDFYSALGIVGAGPLGAFGRGTQDSAGNRRIHKLDGQPNHGDPGSFGLREVLGSDPAGATDFLSLDQSGDQTQGDPDKVYSGNSTYLDHFSAGVAFLVIRKADEKGIQLTTLDQHTMEAIVSQGLRGWVWTAPGSRSLVAITNPVWIAVNVYLRGIGLRFASAATAEQFFDVAAAIAAADICDLEVDKIIGAGTETQFKFQGMLRDVKVLKDWIQEVLNNCLGYFLFSNGKLKIGIREDAAAAHSFSGGNILLGSLGLGPVQPAFNRITTSFANRDYEFVADTLPVQDVDHIAYLGKVLDSQLNLAGAAGKSMAGRIGAARLKEELGGVGADEWKAARQAKWRTTALALSVEPGMGVSIVHEDVPGGTGLFRVTGWRLLPDWTIELEGRTITDSMYDQIAGPKAADVDPNPVPAEFFPQPLRPIWHPNGVEPAGDDPFTQARTFGLRQEYRELADGTTEVTLAVSGVLPVNEFIPDTQPPIIRSVVAGSGGSLAQKNYWLAVAAYDGQGRWSPPSNIRRFSLETAVDDNSTLTLEVDWPAGSFDGYALYVGTDERTMCAQSQVAGSLPASIVFAGPPQESTWNMPSSVYKNIKAKVKRVIHGGVIGEQVQTVVTSADRITVEAIAGGAVSFIGRFVTLYAKQSDNTAPLRNYTVTGHNLATGELTVTPDPDEVAIGDVIVVRCQATSVSADSISDSAFVNIVYPDGLAVDAEIGALVRIISGEAKGQLRRVIANSTTGYTVSPAFDPVPEVGDVFIVEAADWQYEAESTPARTLVQDTAVEIRPVVSNLLGASVLVSGILVDTKSNEAPAELSPFRETFLFGEATGGGGAIGAGDAPNITDATAEVVYTRLETEADGLQLHWRLEAAWTLPESDPDFLNLYDVAVALVPVVASVEGEEIAIGTAATGAVEFKSDWFRVGADAEYRVRFYARNFAGESAEEPVVYPPDPATLAVSADVAAPDVLFFNAGDAQEDGSFLPSTRYDSLNERVLVDYSCVRPFSLFNWSGYKVFMHTPDGYFDATGLIPPEAFTQDGGQFVHFGTISIEGQYVPDPAEDWDFVAVSVDKNGLLNLSGSDPTGPTVTLSIGRPTGGSTQEPATPPEADDWELAALQFRPDAAGVLHVFISVTLLDPAPDADYYSLFWQQTDTPVDGEWEEIAADAVAGTWRIRPAEGADWVVALVANKLTYKVGQPADGVDFKPLVIPAWSDAPQGSGLAVGVEYEVKGGVPSGRFVITFSPPNSPEYYYAKVERIRCDSGFTPLGGEVYAHIGDLTGVADGTSQLFEMGWWTRPPSIEYWKFRVSSVNWAGVINSTAAPTANATVTANTKLELNVYNPATIAAHLGLTSGVLGVLPNAITEALIQAATITNISLANGAVITAKLANLAVDNSKLAALAVDAAKLATSAVESTKIANAAVGSAAIANLAVGTAAIQDAAIQNAKLDRASVNKIAIVNADVVSLAAAKITAGTLAAGVIYSDSIQANQIAAGTIAVALTLTAPTLVITSSGVTINIDGTNYIKLTTTANTQIVSLDPLGFQIQSTADSDDVAFMRRGGIFFQNTSAFVVAELTKTAGAGYGAMRLYNASGTVQITARADTGDVTATGTIQATSFNAGSSPVAAINSSAQFVGAGVNCNAGIGGTGFNIFGGSYFGQTEAAIPMVVGVRDNAGTIEYKTRTVDFRGGVITAIGAESAWTPA